ncbi:MAG: TIGR02281 family clan AA aspartic protease [Pseudomonadota bacterium]
MDTNDIMRLVYLGIILVVLGGGLFLTQRRRIGQTLQMVAIWVLIFVGAIAGVGLWNDIRGDLFPRQARFEAGDAVVVPRARDGHYYLTLDINGAPVPFVIDTGATDIVLTQAAAEAAGLDPDNLNYLGRAFTANGEVRTAPVRLDTITIGPYEDRNVFAVVNGGEMDQSLLGMGYLQRWGRLAIEGGELTLTR